MFDTVSSTYFIRELFMLNLFTHNILFHNICILKSVYVGAFITPNASLWLRRAGLSTAGLTCVSSS